MSTSTSSKTVVVKKCPVCNKEHVFTVPVNEIPLAVFKQSNQQSGAPRVLTLICPTEGRMFKVQVQF